MTTAAQRAAYQYNYTEPHPSVPKSSTLSTGRGGAGNATRLAPNVTKGASATGPASLSPLSSPNLGPRRLSTGRGGAGNLKDKKHVAIPGEPTVYELERDARHDHHDAITADKRVWHHGRGGEGNMINQLKAQKKEEAKGKDTLKPETERRGSNESVISSGSSVADGRPKKGSRAGSFTDKIAAKLGARRGSKSSQLAA